MSRKLALIIGNSEFEDRNLAQLVTPDADVNALAEVLRAPEIGGFDEVIALVNQPSTTVRRAISSFFVGRERNDLLLLYFSGHGIRDDRGQLFLAVKDTEHNLLRGTAIPAGYITEEMDNSRSRRQVLILDCCHSGAFSQGMKGAPGAKVGTAAAFEGTGSGRVVLTATDSTQYAWEGDQLIGQADNSVFTHHLIQGLRTGDADADADGRITLDELYNYVYEQVVDKTPLQTPGKWSYRQQGGIVIARNPRPVVKPVELSLDLQQTIDDSRPWVREGAVQELDRLLKSAHPGLALTALEALKRLADDDSRRVASLAVKSLAMYGEAQSSQEEIKTETQEKQKAREEPERGVAKTSELASAAPGTSAQPGLTPAKVESERKVADQKRAITRQPQETMKPADAHLKLNWRPVLLLIIGWAIPWGVAWAISEANGWYGTVFEISWLLVSPVGGLITGLVLRQTERAIGWKQILIITVGWVVGHVVGDALSTAIFGTTDTFIDLALFGAIGGLVTGIVWYWRDATLHWKQIMIITLGWAIGWGILHYIGHYLYDNFPVSILGGSNNAYFVPGAISAVIPVAIGSLVMFWQFGKLRTPASSLTR